MILSFDRSTLPVSLLYLSRSFCCACVNSAIIRRTRISLLASIFYYSRRMCIPNAVVAMVAAITPPSEAAKTMEDNSSDSGRSGYVPPPPAPPCDMSDCACAQVDGRMNLYEPPGMYYNGTITASRPVKLSRFTTLKSHRSIITLRKARFEKLLRKPNQASEPAQTTMISQRHTRTQPFYSWVQRGDSSDTKPVFWALRAFQL